MSEELILPEQEVVLNEGTQLDDAETVKSPDPLGNGADENTELLKRIDAKLDVLLKNMDLEV